MDGLDLVSDVFDRETGGDEGDDEGGFYFVEDFEALLCRKGGCVVDDDFWESRGEVGEDVLGSIAFVDG